MSSASVPQLGLGLELHLLCSALAVVLCLRLLHSILCSLCPLCPVLPGQQMPALPVRGLVAHSYMLGCARLVARQGRPPPRKYIYINVYY